MRRGFLAALLLAWAALAPAQALRAWSGGATPPLELQDLDGAAHRLADVGRSQRCADPLPAAGLQMAHRFATRQKHYLAMMQGLALLYACLVAQAADDRTVLH